MMNIWLRMYIRLNIFLNMLWEKCRKWFLAVGVFFLGTVGVIALAFLAGFISHKLTTTMTTVSPLVGIWAAVRYLKKMDHKES